MTTEKIKKLYPDEKYSATCPECGGISWRLMLDGIGDDWNKIKGTECLNPDCDFYIDWISVERVDKPKELPKNTTAQKQKVVHIKDGAGSIQHLQALIEAIRDNKVSKFICIDQCELIVPEECKVVDVFGEDLNIGEKFSANSFYFFGDCPTSQLLGLSSRMTHILNESMDGVDVYRDTFIDEEEE